MNESHSGNGVNMKIIGTLFSLVAVTSLVMPQTPDSVNFFPHHPGDVWQYRSYYTGDLIFTQFFDRDSSDSSGNTFVWFHYNDGGTGIYRIDSLNNVFEQTSPSDTTPAPLLYKLEADSGESWRYRNIGPTDSIVAKVVGVFPGFVFGRQVTIKKIDYRMYQSTGPFWIGNRYLATGFGFVQWDVEPSDVYVLSAAIINGVKYGTVVSVERELPLPQTFDVLTSYPNPFNNSTIISYSISVESHVTITIYDILGRALKTVVDERKHRGQFELQFEASGMTSGLYFAVMRTNSNMLIHKILYLR